MFSLIQIKLSGIANVYKSFIQDFSNFWLDTLLVTKFNFHSPRNKLIKYVTLFFFYMPLQEGWILKNIFSFEISQKVLSCPLTFVVKIEIEFQTLLQESHLMFWMYPGCSVGPLTSRLTNQQEEDMQSSAWKIRINSLVTFSYLFIHMDALILVYQQALCWHWMLSRRFVKSDR